ncbi:MAG TPA: M56 family metallopeptidase, partial [Candidatus Angelobacter sp.]|nr:M56 family metallopeptidase [Candidatus Angelobacter sp.]
PVAKLPAVNHYTATLGDIAPVPEQAAMAFVAAHEPPAPTLSIAGGILATGITVSLVLLLWSGFRWWQVRQTVKSAAEAVELTDALETAQRLAGFHSSVRLKTVEEQVSPAVCGLFQPVILLPRALTENLSATSLRTILVHEIVHLRRRDVWVNCAQVLLQIVYWWHPLLWLANASIRRVREEAVDDAVMLSLRDDSAEYASTLLEVARMALPRPLINLGLVGILETRSALRQRIERLVNFHPPRTAGLTFFSLCGIFAFSAVALPMGESPLPAENPPARVAAEVGEQPPPAILSGESALPLRSSHLRRKSVLIEARIFQMNDDDLRKFTSGLGSNRDFSGSNAWWSASPGQFISLLANLDTSHRPLIQRPRILTSDGMPAEFYVGDQTNSIELVCTPLVGDGSIDLNFKSIAISGASANPLINQFSTITSVETGGGMVLRMNDQVGPANNNLVALLSAEIITNTPHFQQRLQAIIKPANQLHGLAPAADSTNQLFARTFQVDPRTFASSLKQFGVDLDEKTNSPSRISAGFRPFFDGLGLDMMSPPGKSVFYSHNTGMLFVRATENDLDLIERAVIALNTRPPQIHIKARFIYVPKGAEMSFESLKFTANADDGSFTGILSSTNARTVLQTMESRKNAEMLAEPEVTTLSGRQTLLRATQIITVITNFAYQPTGTNGSGSVTPQVEQVETGPILDVVPYVLADGYTINLTIIPSLTEFLGYDTPPDEQLSRKDTRVELPVILPRFSVRSVTTSVNLQDDQTVIVGGMPENDYINGIPHSSSVKSAKDDRELLVMITATIVDEAGNRVHQDK